MALDATKPSDTDSLTTHAEYIRETRTEVNGITADSDFDQTNLAIAAGTTILAVGTDLSVAAIDVVNVSGNVAVAITNITLGTVGQIKYFIAENDNVSFTNNALGVNGGVIRLNQVPAVGTYNLALGDILCLCNVGGGNGYWKELFRTLYVG